MELLPGIRFSWRLAGLLPLTFGLICYGFNITHHVNAWEFLWVCPVAAILSGVAVLSGKRFFISAVSVWIVLGPLVVLLFRPQAALYPWHFHHIASVLVLCVIVYNYKKAYDPKGFVFGVASFDAYILITSYLSGGQINMLWQWYRLDIMVLYFGALFVVASAAIFFWHYFDIITQ